MIKNDETTTWSGGGVLGRQTRSGGGARVVLAKLLWGEGRWFSRLWRCAGVSCGCKKVVRRRKAMEKKVPDESAETRWQKLWRRRGIVLFLFSLFSFFRLCSAKRVLEENIVFLFFFESGPRLSEWVDEPLSFFVLLSTVGEERVNRVSWHLTSLSNFITVGVCGEKRPNLFANCRKKFPQILNASWPLAKGIQC